MSRRQKMRVVYRDTKTGRLASKATWKRSKAQGGTRYVRNRIKLPRNIRRKKLGAKVEYQINVKYKPNQSVKAEVQISARGPTGQTRKQAIQAVEERHRTGRNPQGWDVRIIEWRKGEKKFPVNNEGWQQLNFFADQAKFK